MFVANYNGKTRQIGGSVVEASRICDLGDEGAAKEMKKSVRERERESVR